MVTRVDLTKAALRASVAGQLVEAERLAKEAVALPTTGHALADADLESILGCVFQTTGCHDLAIKAFERAVNLAVSAGASQVQCDMLRYLRGEHLYLIKCHAEAISVLSEVSKTSINYPHARALVAASLGELERPESRQVAAEALAAADSDQVKHVRELLGRHLPTDDLEVGSSSRE